MNRKELAETIILVAIAAIVIVVLVFYRPTVLGGDTRYEPVNTGSMEPAIGVGSVVVIKPVDSETLEIGEVICYSFSESNSITHRIVNITDEGFITKGDANEDQDYRPVKKEDVIGKVILVIPFVGYLGYFVRTPLGFIALVVVPAAALIVFEMRSIIGELKKSKDKTKHTEDLIDAERQTKHIDLQKMVNAIKTLTAQFTKPKVTLIFGMLFLIGGLSLWLYSTAVIFGHEQMLATSNLPIEEVWRYEGALQWWRNTYTTAIIPWTILLAAAGLTALLAPMVLKKIRKTKTD